MANLKYEYKLITAQFFEHILEELNDHASEGWVAVLSTNEYGMTKVILEREKE